MRSGTNVSHTGDRGPSARGRIESALHLTAGKWDRRVVSDWFGVKLTVIGQARWMTRTSNGCTLGCPEILN